MQKSVWIGLTILLVLSFFSPAVSQKRINDAYYALGAELDLIPYLSGGYNASLWWGYNHVRVRGVVSKNKVPGFLIPDGFEENKVTYFGASGDYFFDRPFKNLWVGGGAGYWNGTATNSEDSTTAAYSNVVLSVGAGLVIKIWEGFYINPSGGMFFAVAGDKEIEAGNAIYKPPVITPEFSIRIGYHFRI